MTNDSLQYTALSRLLVLNNQVHDLENQLRQVALPPVGVANLTRLETAPLNRIAEMQEEIDQGVRASLVTCWLGMPGDPEI